MTTNQKILLCSKAVKGKIAFGDSLSSRTQIEDFPLKGSKTPPKMKGQISPFRIERESRPDPGPPLCHTPYTFQFITSIENIVYIPQGFAEFEVDHGDTAILNLLPIAVREVNIPMGCNNICPHEIKDIFDRDIFQGELDFWKLVHEILIPLLD
jgi:hypothetical protein